MPYTLLVSLSLLLPQSMHTDAPAPVPPAPEGLHVAPWAHASVDRCAERLDAAGLQRFHYLTPRKVKRLRRGRRAAGQGERAPDQWCHVPQAIEYTRGPGGIEWSGYLLVGCRMALALARLEVIAQEEAERAFGEGRRVSFITQYGTYKCRRLRGGATVQSQHSFGNAIDIGAFHVKGIGRLDIKKYWRARWPAQQSRSDFLHAVARRLRDERVFTHVLTPEFDRSHRNHFHLDLAEDGEVSNRTDGSVLTRSL